VIVISHVGYYRVFFLKKKIQLTNLQK